MNISKLSIFNQININFRNYAIYTLQNRGIPNFYDSLTNVQKLILLNTPTKSVKTLTVVGSCISDGYDHGDASLNQAINRLARPFSCSENILIGDGFFGTQIKPLAAATRYTSVYLNPKINEILSKYKYLIEKDVEGKYESLPIDFPIGLLIPVIGIAVGYRTQILPRKLEHIQEFLAGKRKTLKPYFKNFNGEITQLKDFTNAWLIEGEIKIDEDNKIIEILSLPPLMKYEKFIKKISSILNEYDGCTVVNNSKTDVNIKITFNKHISDDFWTYVKERISKSNKLIIRENIVFIKDNQVLEYENVENYLHDFRNKNLTLVAKYLKYLVQDNRDELKFIEAKIKFLNWVIGVKHTEAEMNNFLRQYPKQISERLDNIKARNITEEEIARTELKKIEILGRINELINTSNEHEKVIENTDFTLLVKTKRERNLIDIERKEIDGIEVSNLEEFETFTSEDIVNDEDSEED